MKIGDSRDTLDPAKIGAATSHPLKNVWWVVYDSRFLLTVEEWVITAITECESNADAHRQFMAIQKGWDCGLDTEDINQGRQRGRT